MKRKELIKLLQSGQFSVIYHDNEAPCIYAGKGEYEDFDEDTEDLFPDEHLHGHGYVPGIVSLLVEALGGKTDSI